MTLLLSAQFNIFVEIFAWLHFFLFIYFAIGNVKFGAARRYSIVNTRINRKHEKSKIGITNIVTAHIRQAHIVIAQIVIATLLICTHVGHDVLDHLAAKYSGLSDDVNLWETTVFCFWRFVDTVLILGSVFFYSTAIWLIPWHLKAPNARAEQFQNKTMLVLLRAMGMITYLIIALALVASSYHEQNEKYVSIIYACLLWFYVIYWVIKGYDEYYQKSYSDRYLLWVMGGVFVVAVCRFWYIGDLVKLFITIVTAVLAAVFWSLTRKHSKWEKGGRHRYPSISNIIQRLRSLLVLMDKKLNGFFMEKFKLKPEPKPAEPYAALGGEGWWIQHNRMVYRILFCAGWAFALILSFFKNIQELSPFIIIFSGIGFIFMFIGNVFLTGRRLFNGNDVREEKIVADDARWYEKFRGHLANHVLPWFIAFVIAALYLITNSHNGLSPIQLVKKTKTTPERISIDAYLNRYVAHRTAKIQADSTKYPVFIFAGQGGGSRAGYWTASALVGLDQRYPIMDLAEHTLAISTVSGSAPGTVAALQWWDRDIDSDSLKYTKEIYQQNFVTSGISGVLYSDLIKRFWPWPIRNYFRGRNERLSIEESKAMHNAYLSTNTKQEKNQSYFGDKPFSELYIDSSGDWRTDLPLFLPNSTHVQSGRRAVVSPVIKPDIFLNSLLVSKNTATKKKELSVIQAADLSQYFPYISAAGNISGSENMYVDGGYFENYGLTTAHELYDACLKWQNQQADTSVAKALDFYIIATINSDLPENLDSIQYECVSQLVAPINTALVTRFSGHSVHKLKEVDLELGDNFKTITFKGEGIPLTRLLTPENMLVMDSSLMSEFDSLDSWFAEINNKPWSKKILKE